MTLFKPMSREDLKCREILQYLKSKTYPVSIAVIAANVYSSHKIVRSALIRLQEEGHQFHTTQGYCNHTNDNRIPVKLISL